MEHGRASKCSWKSFFFFFFFLMTEEWNRINTSSRFSSKFAFLELDDILMIRYKDHLWWSHSLMITQLHFFINFSSRIKIHRNFILTKYIKIELFVMKFMRWILSRVFQFFKDWIVYILWMAIKNIYRKSFSNKVVYKYFLSFFFFFVCSFA